MSLNHPPKSYPSIGIDLGTTNSLVAVYREGQPELIPNSVGGYLTPSVVGVLEDGTVVVGSAAKELRVTHPHQTASCFKRWMGQDKVITISKRNFSPVELSGLVLRSLKEDASEYLGEEVKHAVITVPAYFNNFARNATRAAGEMAGLIVDRLVNEPTAAALVYGHQNSQEEKKCCIVDLGGGTFDVTFMDVFEGTLEILSSSGESFLGGEDFTDRITAYVLSQVKIELEHAELKRPLLVSRLRSLCEEAKRKLAPGQSEFIRVPNDDGSVDDRCRQVELSFATFQEICVPLLKRITNPISKAMRDSRLSPKDIDDVILVGGGTRLPLVQHHIKKLFDKKPSMRFNPDEVVALGASVQSALLTGDEGVEELMMTDVCPHTLGIEVSKKFGSQYKNGYFHPLLHRNSTIPISKEEIFSTVNPNQTQVDIKVYQGDSRIVEENTLLGELLVTGLPPAPAGTPFYVRFTYDVSGVVEVEAYHEKGPKFQTVLTHKDNKLTASAIEQARARIAKLKFYPREDAPTLKLLHYAQRLVGELIKEERAVLEDALDIFESAMTNGDKELLLISRENLLNIIERLGFPRDADD